MPTISKKAKITAEICREQISAVVVSRFWLSAIFFFAGGLLNLSKNIMPGIALLSIGAVILLYCVYYTQITKRAINRRNYYLEEDTLIEAVKKKRSNGGKVSSYNYHYRYDFTFQNNGKYRLKRSRSQVEKLREDAPENDFADLDGEAVKYFHEDERFYCLVLDLGRRKRITQIFNTSLFYIDKNDFTESDEKYYPKP